MIKFNNSNINDWDYGTSNIIKVYRNNAVCYYKIDVSSPSGQTPCFAVVTDISQYTDTEFEDVFNKANNKWYKLNNLNVYEEYGVYGSGRNITYYDGKLTIDGDYEYQYSGGTWNNVGEISGSSRVPAGYTEVEYIENKNAAYIDTGFKPNQDTRIVATMQTVTSTSYGRFLGCGGYDKTNAMQFDYETGAQGTLHISWGHKAGWTIYSSCVGDYNIHTYDWDKNTFYRDKGEANQFSATTAYTNFQCQQNLSIFMAMQSSGPDSGQAVWKGKMYDFKLYDNGTLIRDLVPCKRNSDSKYGGYDVVNDVFYPSPSSTNSLTGGSEYSPVEYPIYYDELQDPPNNLSFSSMTEAESYECPWVGMKATIDGDKYVFSGDSTSGYEWVYTPSRLPAGYTEVEYIENTSTAYINTGFKPNQSTKILITTQCVTSTSGGRHIGAGGYDKTNAIQFDYESGAQGTLHISWGTTAGWTTYSSCVGDYNKHTYEWDGNVFYRDKGEQNQFSATTAYGTYQCTDNLGIFTRYQNGSGGGSSECFRGKVFDFKMYDNGTLIRDLVPCKRDNDSKAGMYDIVNDVFYSSANSYNFVAGPVVN